MRAIAQFPFQGHPSLPQLSFPAGAVIQPKPEEHPNQGGWMFGSYMGRKGWFPESYVELKREAPQQQQQQQLTPHRPRSSPVITHSDSIAFENDLPSLDLNNNGTIEEEECFSGMMGGTPGDLFEGAPKPVYYSNAEQQPSPTFLREPEEEPVDIYRHAPARKTRFNRNKRDYSPEISVQITPKEPSSPQPNVRSLKQVSPVSTTTEFWKAHPGRLGPPTMAEQAYEVEKGFEGLRDSDTIEIKFTEKKKRFRLPKSIKKAAQKTVQAVKGH